MHASGYLRMKTRKERANRSAFAALIATPAVGDFSMPAGARIRFVATAGATAGTTAATLSGAFRNPNTHVAEDRVIKTPVLAAGGWVKLDRVERAVSVDPEAGFEVQLDTGLGVWVKIAEGA